MGRYRRLLCAAALGIAVGACDSTAPPPPLDGRIDGAVHAEGEPLSGVLLQLESSTAATTRSTVSRADGTFGFDGLDEGDYAVRAAGLPDRVLPEALEAQASLSRQQPSRRVEL
ncbi:MAG: carboxypeptidase regulatory-like domain-containing protein, partial [Gemmatimonadetes bacterium]|nr:carboxypeptidase regulatory-like domain-containing protein [Gemmatimonadota bacterium]